MCRDRCAVASMTGSPRSARSIPAAFAAFAALPLVDISAAAAELERALGLPGIIGAQIPGNAFLTRKDAEAMRPLFDVANRHRAVLFIHHGPRPGDAFPKVAGDTDNARRRNGTLDMQASLSSAMVTLCLTDYLADFPDATVCVHNLGGNIPYEVERMDHRCLLDTPNEELPSSRFRKAKVYVDCNSFGPRAIEAAVRLYGAERIVCGTDGTEFGCDWTRKALAEAEIGDDAREQILHEAAPEHESLLHLAWGRCHLDGEFVRSAHARDRQLGLRKCLKLRICRRRKRDQQAGEYDMAARQHGASQVSGRARSPRTPGGSGQLCSACLPRHDPGVTVRI
jgi:predicted TIM-barrel fold metal-dependent hydrolase